MSHDLNDLPSNYKDDVTFKKHIAHKIVIYFGRYISWLSEIKYIN
jgi:hypothetical protein